jgi:hypothetical protein
MSMALGNLAGRLGWAAVSDKIGTVPVMFIILPPTGSVVDRRLFLADPDPDPVIIKQK